MNKFLHLLCEIAVLLSLTCCAQSPDPDPVSVVQAFYQAASDEDMDAFLGLLAEDAEIEWGREGIVTGVDNIQNRAQILFLDFDFTFILSDLEVDGNRVTFSHKMVIDNTQTVVEECVDVAVVEGGKIKSSMIVACEYP